MKQTPQRFFGRAPKQIGLLPGIAAILALGITPAHAYLDPGTGSMITQFVIAAFVAAAFSVKRVASLIKRTVTMCAQWPFILFRRDRFGGSRENREKSS